MNYEDDLSEVIRVRKREPSYVALLESGRLEEVAREAEKSYRCCDLCPRECSVDRRHKAGFCRALDRAVVSNYGPHFGEESVLVGTNGSGTVFFAHCTLGCVFCQNADISIEGQGEEISNRELADIMLELQRDYRCHNINLVTPTHFVPNIIEAVLLAAGEGLRIPLVYNCGGYESLKTLRLLDGIVDIYMPDFKYDLEDRAIKYSKARGYPEAVKEALREMDRQVGGLKVDEKGLAYRGLIIRHLMLPGGLEDTRRVLQFIHRNLSEDCLVNLMDQYYPAHRAREFEELRCEVAGVDFRKAVAYASELGLRLAD